MARHTNIDKHPEPFPLLLYNCGVGFNDLQFLSLSESKFCLKYNPHLPAWTYCFPLGFFPNLKPFVPTDVPIPLFDKLNLNGPILNDFLIYQLILYFYIFPKISQMLFFLLPPDFLNRSVPPFFFHPSGLYFFILKDTRPLL